MDFALTADHVRIQTLCRELAADFATRAAARDRDASAPLENYAALRAAGLFGLTIPQQFGGWAHRIHDCCRGNRPGVRLHGARLQHARRHGGYADDHRAFACYH
jgi:alkylation response protein AidB-like acyl-CoA dehydrogenase